MIELKFLLVIFYIQSFCVIFTASKIYESGENVEDIEDSGIEPTSVTSDATEMTSAVTGDATTLADITTKTEESTDITTLSDKYERIITNPMPDLIKKQPETTQDEATIVSTAMKNSASQLCPYFVYSAGFDMDKMDDVWQSVYYKMTDRLACFKILVRKTSQEERSQNEDRYGNFDKQMDWKECHFEVRSSESETTGRKHFLQGGVADMGVMRNIILVPDENDDYVLQEESPDQWMMLKGLLLLRDCDSGGMVAFARVPQRPRKEEIQEAFNELGEEMTGELLCEDP